MKTELFTGSILAALSAVSLIASPASASEPSPPMIQRDVSATDVAATPANDLNLRKDDIPRLLIDAQDKPYALSGLGNCRRLTAAVGSLDAVLGDDVDLPQNDDGQLRPGRVAQSVVGSFIPFRGVIRELSGANEHDRKMRVAILAGVARRSFLKGTGQARGCAYPARAMVAGGAAVSHAPRQTNRAAQPRP